MCKFSLESVECAVYVKTVLLSFRLGVHQSAMYSKYGTFYTIYEASYSKGQIFIHHENMPI